MRPSDGRRLGADHRCMPQCGVVVSVALVAAVGGLCLPVEGELRERTGHNERRRTDDQTPARQASFSHV